MKKGLTYAFIFLLFYTLAFVLSIVLTWINIGIMLSVGIYISVFVLQIAVLALARRHLMRRVVVKEGAGYLVIPIGLLMAATMVTASVERAAGSAGLADWTTIPGILFLFMGYFIAISSLNATPPHAHLRYAEQTQDGSRGPYDVIRCPVELAAVLLSLSVPLYFGAALAFIPAGLSVVLIIVEAALKDHWRFVHYEYYFDYTKRVAYVLIPLIW